MLGAAQTGTRAKKQIYRRDELNSAVLKLFLVGCTCRIEVSSFMKPKIIPILHVA